MYTILRLNVFCWYNGKSKELAVANDDYFASKAWRVSDKAFNSIIGESFGWHSIEDRESYCNSKYYFSRPTKEEIIHELWSNDKFEEFCLKYKLVSYKEVEHVPKEKIRKDYLFLPLHPNEEDLLGPIGDR